MTAQHTPGPWRVAKNKYDDDAPIIEMGPPAHRRVLYLTASGDLPGDYDDVSAANARLIAAAPDLLDALVAVMRALTTSGDADAVAVQAFSAIGKATGEASS